MKGLLKNLGGAVAGKVLGTLQAEPTRVGIGVAALTNAVLGKVAHKNMTGTQQAALGMIVNLVAGEVIRAVVTPTGKPSAKTLKAVKR